jgi:hypothetical protein
MDILRIMEFSSGTVIQFQSWIDKLRLTIFCFALLLLLKLHAYQSISFRLVFNAKCCIEKHSFYDDIESVVSTLSIQHRVALIYEHKKIVIRAIFIAIEKA